MIDICNSFSITPSQLLIDSLNLNLDIFTESVQQEFSKLSNEDKKFLQELFSKTIELLLKKE